jgi:hypothetical protein
LHVTDDRAVIALGHKAVERTVATDGEQFEVGEGPGGQLDNGQRGRELMEGVRLRAARQQVNERAAVGFVGFGDGRFVQLSFPP